MAAKTDAGPGPPCAFFRSCEAALRETAAIGPTLDLACGRGRHALAASALGLSVLAVDRNAAHLAELVSLQAADPESPRGRGVIATRVLDLEAPEPPALPERHFGAVLVFRYLHRPLFGWIESLVAPGGILVYETFTRDQRRLGWGPRRDAFLLEPGELPTLLHDLEVERFEEGLSEDTPPAQTARLLARRPRQAPDPTRWTSDPTR